MQKYASEVAKHPPIAMKLPDLSFIGPLSAVYNPSEKNTGKLKKISQLARFGY
jgi:hypothetical protein